jgi:uncharacterized protein (TIGR00369 family)
VAAAGYPPARHILRDLAIEVAAVSGTEAVVRLPWSTHLAGDDGGVRAGALTILVDVLGGALGARALTSGRVATADLSLQVVRPLLGPVVEARGAVLRHGRTTLVVEVEVSDIDVDGGVAASGEAGRSGPSAFALLTFAILPPDPDRPAPYTVGPSASVAPSPVWAFSGGLDRPLVDTLDLEVADPATGVVSMQQVPYVANSFGAVQGGVIGLLAEQAAGTALGHRPDGRRMPVVVDSMQVAYLAQGRVGPVTSTVEVLAPVSERGTGGAVVTLRDAGSGGRVTTVVNVVARSVARTSDLVGGGRPLRTGLT